MTTHVATNDARLRPFVGPGLALASAAPVVPGVSGSLLAVIAIALLPVTARHIVSREFRLPLIALLLWAASVCVSTLIFGASIVSMIANCFYPFTTLAVAAFVNYLSGHSPDRLLSIATWLGLGILVGAITNSGSIYADLSPLKTGLGLGVAVLAFGATGALRLGRVLAGLIASTIGAAFIVSDFRSMGIIILLATVAAWAAQAQKSRRGTVVLSIQLVSLATVLVLALMFALERGWFGAQAATRFLEQSASPAGLLQAARPETVVAAIALRTSWLTGRGFGASLSGQEASDALSTYANLGMPLNAVQTTRILGEGINAHSLLFSNWIGAGVGAALAILLLAAFVVRGSISALRFPSTLTPLAVFAGISLTWDVVFSPWNARGEVWLGLAIAVACTALHAPRMRAQLEVIPTSPTTDRTRSPLPKKDHWR